MREIEQERQTRLRNPHLSSVPGVSQNGNGSGGATPRWEYLSVIVWDDDPKSAVNSDLEDVELLNLLGADGWDLVCVVPLARTRMLEMAYPGDTRKLLAYFKRPRH